MEQRGLKRKRISSGQKKRVRFSTSPELVYYTYSSIDYDRRATQTLYKVNPTLLNNNKPKLSVDIPTHFVAADEDESSIETPADEFPMSTTTKPKKLSIDTSMCAGPLFMTTLSTSYQDDDTSNDFLVPLSAHPI